MSLLDVAIRRAGVGIETWMAALAALVTGAAVFLMPIGVLQEAVRASGMADLLPALQPPLGWKARMGLALLSAGSAFGTALLLMRIAGRLTAASPRLEEAEVAPMVPRVRRRDAHPDAPARAPLSVTRDLGVRMDQDPVEAAEESRQEEEERVPALRRPAAEEQHELRPARSIRRAPPAPAPAARSPLPWLDEAEEEPSRPQRLSRLERAAKQVARPDEQEPEEPDLPEEPDQSEEVEALQPEAAAAEAEAAGEPAERDRGRTAQPTIIVEPVEPEPQPAPVHARPEPVGASADEDIVALLARFEQAMERRTARPRAEPEARSDSDEDGTDMRLRSALENLKRFAPR